MHKLFFILLLTVSIAKTAAAQDTLPHISVKDVGGKIIVSWKNNYGAKINNINIQRSADSLKGFTTIGSVLEPMNRENGYVDTKAPDTKMFYRVFVAFYGGSYVFSKSYRPAKDTAAIIPPSVEVPKDEPSKPLPPKGFVASRFVFTGKDNNVVISLPDALHKKYSVKFFDENETPLFEISKVPEPYVIIEKVNFLHSGWFYFELYENGALIEKHKFNIAKENGKSNGGHERGQK